MKLFEPCKIGKMELRNRLVLAPISDNMAQDGFVTDRMVEFYKRRAEGGAGLITIGDGIVEVPRGNNVKNALGIDDDKYIPMLKELTRAVQACGAKVCMQLSHGGRRAGRVAKSSGYLEVTRGVIPVAPSALPHPVTGQVVPSELTVEEIAELVEKFGQGARRAREAGVDAVGLHCAHMYLCGEFLSPWANRRTDGYGGNLEGRLRFVLEAIGAMRRAVGADFPILVRINGQEPEGGNTLEDIRKIAQKMEEAGVDAIHVSVGFGAPVRDPGFIPSITPMRTPDGCIVHLAENVKRGVSIPVIAVNKIRDVHFAESIIQEGKADLIAMARTLIADPDFLNKASQGRYDDIVPCISCCQGCVANVLDRDLPVACTVNPVAGREREVSITPAKKRRRVLIVGGGPAGMETAIVAATRGHEVLLYEKDAELGGNLRIATIPPGKTDLGKLIKYLKTQVARLGVRVELRSEATPEVIEKAAPDVLIVAIGGKPVIPAIPGVEGKNVIKADSLLRREAETGIRVVVIGGGQVGLETAEYLAEEGKRVMIIEMLDDVGVGLPSIVKLPLLLSLERHGVEILTRATAEEVKEAGVVISRKGKRETVPADTVVLAAGFQPDVETVARLREACPESYVVGDSVKARTILEAMHEGFDVALRI